MCTWRLFGSKGQREGGEGGEVPRQQLWFWLVNVMAHPAAGAGSPWQLVRIAPETADSP